MQLYSSSKQSLGLISHLVTDIFDGPRRVTFKLGGLMYIQLGGLQTGEIYPDLEKQVDPCNLNTRFILCSSDVLLSKTGDTPRAALVSSEFAGATISPDIYCLRMKPGLVSPAWLTYYFNSKLIREMLSEKIHGKTIPRLHLADLKQFPVILPTTELAREVEQLEEQAQEHSHKAYEIWTATLRGVFAEIDKRLGLSNQGNKGNSEYVHFLSTVDTTFDKSFAYFEKSFEEISIVPLYQIAKIEASSRKNFDPDKIVRYVQSSDIDPRHFLFRNVRSDKVRNLPARIRLPIRAYQVLLLASGSNLGTPNHPVGIVEPDLDGCLASNTFLALEFHETPLYYGMVLKHPLVLAEIRHLAVGKVICTLRKRDVMYLKIPVLGRVWRQDFNDRAKVAWERRNLAKNLRSKAQNLVDTFVQQNLMEIAR